jgi:hypothetical protein
MSKKELIGTYPMYAVYARYYAIYANNTSYAINVKKVDTRGFEQKIFDSASDTYATVLISRYQNDSFLGYMT